jgi:hypothetical protein
MLKPGRGMGGVPLIFPHVLRASMPQTPKQAKGLAAGSTAGDMESGGLGLQYVRR